jgi:hypothetical protein
VGDDDGVSLSIWSGLGGVRGLIGHEGSMEMCVVCTIPLFTICLVSRCFMSYEEARLLYILTLLLKGIILSTPPLTPTKLIKVEYMVDLGRR